jgi:DNA-binding MarR family transcriptional regulator
METKDIFFENYGLRILTAIRRIIRAVDSHSHKLNEEFNITAAQLICLYSLANKGQMTQSQLAKEICMGMSTLNGIIDRLEHKKLVVRKRDEADRRKVFVNILPAGKDLTKSAPALLQDKLSDSLRKLPELEQVSIALSLERVVELMQADHLDASPNLIGSFVIDEKSEKNNEIK